MPNAKHNEGDRNPKPNLRKIVVLCHGTQDSEVWWMNPPPLDDDGEEQVERAAQKLERVLKHETTVIIYPSGSHRHLIQTAEIVARRLGPRSQQLQGEPWDAQDPQNCGRRLDPEATAIVLVGGNKDQQRFHREFVAAGYRDLSARLLESRTGSPPFTYGSFWVADLERRTLYCGRRSAR